MVRRCTGAGLDAAAFDLLDIIPKVWRQNQILGNLRPDIGDEYPRIELLSDAMKIDSQNMSSRTVARCAESAKHQSHPQLSREMQSWLADDKYASMKEVGKVGGAAGLEQRLLAGAKVTFGSESEVELPPWVLADSTRASKASSERRRTVDCWPSERAWC